MDSIILASESTRRREWLSSRIEGMGVSLEFCSIMEPEPKPKYGSEVSNQVEAACLHKAEHALLEWGGMIPRGGLMVVADTLVEDPDESRHPLGKPTGHLEAAAMLIRLSGRRHRVWSSTAIAYPPDFVLKSEDADSKRKINARAIEIWTDFSIVEFDDMGEEGVANLVNSGSWMGKAGGYDIAGEASDFLTLVEGGDEAVLGFSPRAIHRLVDLIG